MRAHSLVLLPLLFTAPILALPIAWTITHPWGPDPVRLIRFNAVTGDVLANIAFQGPTTIGGLAFNPANGELWSVIPLANGSSQAVAINTTDGSYQARSAGLIGISGLPQDLAFDDSGNLHFLSYTANTLYSYNIGAGTFAFNYLLSPGQPGFDGCNGFSGLTFFGGALVTSANCPSNVSPANGERRFYNATTSTSMAAALYPFNSAAIGNINNPGFDAYGGVLYGLWGDQSFPGGNGSSYPRLSTYDPNTGASSAGIFVNSQGVGQFSALAFEPAPTDVVPEPSAWATCALGTLLMFAARALKQRG